MASAMRIRLFVTLASFLALATAAPAATVTLTAAKDAAIYSDIYTGNANGAGIYVHVGTNSEGNYRRGLMQFDLSSIPAGSTITAVTLTLWVDTMGNSGPSEAIELHKLTQSWNEGSTNPTGGGGGHGAPATTGDVTWIYRNFTSQAWTNQGGTFSGTVSASTVVTSASGTKTWSTAGMVTDVQAWLTTPSTNFGWLLKGNEGTDQTARRISSRQNPTVSERPTLSVTYTPPPTTGACCNPTTGTCSITSPITCILINGNHQGNGTTCAPNPCPQPTGACCTGGGVCSITDNITCTAQGRYYHGNNVLCLPNPCPVFSGACCQNNATCTFVTQAACTTAAGTYQGDNITCATADCPWVLTPFMDALPIPPVAAPTSGTAGGTARYDLFIREFSYQFHSQLPLSRVWGYNGSYPGPTIEARRNLPVTAVWHNDLHNSGQLGNPLRTTHILPVDTCLHGPDVTGVVPVTVTHLHGAHLRSDSDGDPDTAFAPGLASPVYNYPNNQQAATLWYHDHALGLTRLNVYMGLAGFYLIRDSVEDALNLPSGEFEVPLVIQDRSFDATGALKYNATFVDHFFGDFACVNGKVWPYMNVKRGKYRFRMLNGSNTRSYTLRLNVPVAGVVISVPAWQIGSDGGLLAAPVPLGGSGIRPVPITLMPGERVDVIVDFAGFSAGTTVLLQNSAPVPFPGGGDGPDILNVMQFRVQATTGFTGAVPASLTPVPRIAEAEASVTRTFMLNKVTDITCNHDMWLINQLMWDDITEFPQLGATEIWRWVNQSGLSHPMHIHLVEFQILDRQDFTLDANNNVVPSGVAVAPGPAELGWKDTVQATPNQITRVIARFTDYPGTFPFHCHILDHEDHEMMRQFTVQCAPLAPTLEPTSTQVNLGGSTGFAFAATGSQPLTYQWRLNAVPLVNGVNAAGSTISGATSGAITIANAHAPDAGSYSCVITDPCGSIITSLVVPLTIHCPGDFNNSGSATVQDIFDFLTAWFAGTRFADFNGDGLINIQDIFDFLSAWFNGC